MFGYVSSTRQAKENEYFLNTNGRIVGNSGNIRAKGKAGRGCCFDGVWYICQVLASLYYYSQSAWGMGTTISLSIGPSFAGRGSFVHPPALAVLKIGWRRSASGPCSGRASGGFPSVPVQGMAPRNTRPRPVSADALASHESASLQRPFCCLLRFVMPPKFDLFHAGFR